MIQRIQALHIVSDKININSATELEAFRIEYLGSKGQLKDLYTDFKSVPGNEKREIGQALNTLKIALENFYSEQKEKFSTIFEAAVSARVSIEEARLEEEFETRLGEEVEEIKEEITTKIDQYLDYVVESWMEDNKLAVESTLRADIAENFMEGLYNLFAESYITVPEEKLDVVGELKAQIEELETKFDESVNKQLELQSVIDEATMEAAFDEVTEGLAATQVEKLRTLAEGIEFTDSESYVKKLNILKGKYFSEKKEINSGVITEEASEGLTEEAKPVAVGEMANYVSAISRTKTKNF